MIALFAVFIGIGRLIGGPSGAIIAFFLAAAMNLGSYWFSDKIVLRMAGAHPVSLQQAPQLYQSVERLAQRAQIPMPRLYIIDDPQPNAFATGRNPKNAAVAVNTGLLQLLSTSELDGVLAHELAHVKHRDTLTMAIVAALAGGIMLLADMARWGAIFGGFSGRDDEEGGTNPIVFIAALIVAPIAAMLVQMAISRAREYEADATAAHLTGSPRGLMSALGKLERGVHQIPTHSMTPQTAHLCIANPFAGMGGMLSGLFSTHPPMEKRIAALQEVGQQMGEHAL